MLKSLTWYVVEVSYRETNPIHRAICKHNFDGHVELYGNYDDPEYTHVERLHHFKVVEEIKAMGS